MSNTKTYRLKQDFITPCFTVRAGVSLRESEWMERMVNLQEGDCDIKTDWFELVEEPKKISVEITQRIYDTRRLCVDDKGWYKSYHLSVYNTEITPEIKNKIQSVIEQILNGENADDWENKVCLSPNDIKWWLEKYFGYPNTINVNQLKELVKSKINQ